MEIKVEKQLREMQKIFTELSLKVTEVVNQFNTKIKEKID